MLITTTSVIEGAKITRYYGIVSGETIIGANVFRDFFASIRDVVGGRSGSYEEVLREAKDTALREMQEQARLLGANAVIGEYPYLTIRCVAFLLMERRRIGRISGEFCKHSLIFRCAIPGLLVDCL